MEPAQPIHPGEMLLHEFVVPLGLTRRQLALELGWTPGKLSEILRGRRALTADSALDLAKRFRTSAELWMNLQMYHDLHAARERRRAS